MPAVVSGNHVCALRRRYLRARRLNSNIRANLTHKTGARAGITMSQLSIRRTPSHMVYGITDLTTFILGTIVIVLLPGPNSLYVMTVASQRGIGAGYRGALGIFTGDLILMSLATTGMASLFQAQPALFEGLKYAGAAYLAYLGWGLVRAGLAGWRAPTVTAQPAPSASSNRPFQAALLISLMNPKAILFFVSFFIQFVSPTYSHPWLSFVILGVIVQVCSMAYLSALIFGGRCLAEAFRRRRRLAALCTGSVGGLFIGFGIRLAATGLN